MKVYATILVVSGALAGSLASVVCGAEAPSVEQALKLRPIQKDVEFETPEPGQYAKCQVKVERQGAASGWIVLGEQAQPLRRFRDTNSDNIVDQWCYYNRGLEVYRDVDSDFNRKVDQCRWLNTGGSRWGLDTDEDGRINSWKALSAEEATRVAVGALVAGDAQTLQSLLIDDDDLKQLGVKATFLTNLRASVSDVPAKMKAALDDSKSFTRETRWMRFDSSMPNVIPAEDNKAGTDLTVYENVMAIVETKGSPGLVQIGEMVRVGDVWKLTQVPAPLEGNSVQVTEGGILMQPLFAAANAPAPESSGLTPESQKLLEQLQELDRNSPAPTAARDVQTKYIAARSTLLQKLAAASESPPEREQWTRQLVDGLATAVQSAGYADGLKQLKSIETDLRRDTPQGPIVAYVNYRRVLAEYSLGMLNADAAAQAKLQEQWLQQLEQFVRTFPDSEDTPEATLQLAINQEFNGKVADAKKWYEQLARRDSTTPASRRAAGAMRRLGLEGQPLTLSGPGLKGGVIDAAKYRNQVVLVLFWATWCKPCTEDLPQIRALYEQYHDRGFEIVGVNLDATTEPVGAYLSQHRVTWPQMYEPGGLTSPPAERFGIISLPTMFLVGRDGKVTSPNISASDLKLVLPELFKSKALSQK